MNTSFLLFALLNPIFALLAAPLYMALIRKVKAYAQGRKGPRLSQVYYDLRKLLHKETIYSPTSSWIMRFTPYLNLSTLLVASLFVPLVFVPKPWGGFGNVVVFLYLLALERFFTALGGLDAGSAFGGMGSSRSMSLAAVIEPSMVVSFAALAFVLKSLNMHEMFALTASEILPLNPTLVLVSISLFIILIVETGRLPVDNPATHLELTMINEAMILEQTGKNLALLELSHALKQLLLMGILINTILPIGLSTEFDLGKIVISSVLFLLKAGMLAIIVGLFESSLAKMRLFRLPAFYVMAFFFSALTILIEVFA